ncbi:MAG: DUF1592 domain-containing protein [Planctomycetaceae bacterium]|nr:DUF1592 domain-containing protein [Planctomycetaceae bacterium]
MSRPLPIIGCLTLLMLLAAGAASADESRGAVVFRTHCASCHGDRGEGTATEYRQALAGDKSVKELSQYIDKSMPKGSPEDCSAPDAAAVAEYIYDAFYSTLAQARIKPARIELSRLTVRQYQESVADLIGSFRWTSQWGDERGLKCTYAKSRKVWDKKDRVLERTDLVVQFDFGEGSPDPQIEPKEFGMRWEGSVFAPETGEYEFLIRTDNAVKLWINDTETPLVDAWVRSGSDTDFRGRIKLLGGRAYPLRIEYLKSREKRANIALMWQPPHQVLDILPARCLSTQSFPETYVVAAPFPPDDRSVGYERGTSVSKEWDEAATSAAIETADYVLKNLRDLAGIKRETTDREAKYREFCGTFAERAFRRSLSDEQRAMYVDRHFADGADPLVAVKRSVLLTLMSPRFLYRDITASDDGYDRAARLSFALWDSIPDQSLLEAAAKNDLKSEGDLRWRADQMLSDLRAQAKLREFLRQWLKLDHLQDIAKDPSKYPEFDAAVVSDLRTSLELFLDDVIWREGGDFRKLLLDESVYLNGRLASFYGADLPADALSPGVDPPFRKMALNPESRAGVLSHPYLLAGFAYTSTSSPIHRGVFLARNVLGRSLRPPPVAVAPLAPELHADMTTRERVLLQTEAEACQTCHNMINPLGFTLEHFDAVGRYRQEEHGKPIDATGTYLTRTGAEVKFAGVRDLATFLAASDETHLAFVEQLFHFTVKQPIRAYGPNVNAELTRKFVEQNYDIRKLLVEISLVAALTPPQPTP